MSTLEKPRRRGRAAVRALVALGIFVGLAGLAMSMFRLGVMTGLSAAGGVLILYSIPATLFDWPRLSWEDLAAFVSGVLSAIGSFFSSLLDW